VTLAAIMKLIVAVNSQGRRIGDSHPRAKLSDSDVEMILELRDFGLSYEAIAAKWDDGVRISKSTVRDICKGLTRGQIAARLKVVRL
jgi:hypothetical protein